MDLPEVNSNKSSGLFEGAKSGVIVGVVAYDKAGNEIAEPNPMSDDNYIEIELQIPNSEYTNKGRLYGGEWKAKKWTKLFQAAGLPTKNVNYKQLVGKQVGFIMFKTQPNGNGKSYTNIWDNFVAPANLLDLDQQFQWTVDNTKMRDKIHPDSKYLKAGIPQAAVQEAAQQVVQPAIDNNPPF